MHIHENKVDVSGAGRWDAATGRYIPMLGGFRTRLPVADDPSVPRYHGFVGIDEKLTPNIGTVAAYIQLVGGGVYIPEGNAGKFVELILEQSKKWFQPAGQAEGGQAEGG